MQNQEMDLDYEPLKAITSNRGVTELNKTYDLWKEKHKVTRQYN